MAVTAPRRPVSTPLRRRRWGLRAPKAIELIRCSGLAQAWPLLRLLILADPSPDTSLSVAPFAIRKAHSSEAMSLEVV